MTEYRRGLLTIWFAVAIVFLAGALTGLYIPRPPIERLVVVDKVRLVEAPLAPQLESIQVQLDNVLARQALLSQLVGAPTEVEEQCYAGQMVVVSRQYAPIFYGKHAPDLMPVLWSGWVDLCIAGTIRWGDSYGPTEAYGGGDRPPIIEEPPSPGTNRGPQEIP